MKKLGDETGKPGGMRGMMTDEELETCIAKLKAFIESPEGKESLRKAGEKAAKEAKDMEERTKIPWEWMHRPVDF